MMLERRRNCFLVGTDVGSFEEKGGECLFDRRVESVEMPKANRCMIEPLWLGLLFRLSLSNGSASYSTLCTIAWLKYCTKMTQAYEAAKLVHPVWA